MPDSNENRLLRSALGRTAECLPVEKLESLDAQGRAHVDHCTYCQNELAMLTEFRDASPRPEEAADLVWMQAELERRLAPAPPPTGIWEKAGAWFHQAFPSRGWAAVPVAAGLLLLVAGGMYLRTGEERLR